MTLWFQDEARVGQKGRLCHRWWTKGQRPPGRCDQRYEWASIDAAVRPDTGDAFALVMPTVSTRIMALFLERFAATLAPDEHTDLVLDGAGWHATARLRVPENVTLVTLPPYSPQLNPVERVWLFLRERFLSLQVFADADACCHAWNTLVAEPGRIRSLCSQPWLQWVTS